MLGTSEISSEQFDRKSEEISEIGKSVQQTNEYIEKAQDIPDSSFQEKGVNKPSSEAKEHSKFNLSEDFMEILDSFHEKELNKPSSEVKEHSKLNLSEDLKEILELVRASGNRITQRELRKISIFRIQSQPYAVGS